MMRMAIAAWRPKNSALYHNFNQDNGYFVNPFRDFFECLVRAIGTKEVVGLILGVTKRFVLA